ISVPEPSPGRWALSVAVESELEQLPAIFRQGADLPEGDAGPTPATNAYFRQFERYRELSEKAKTKEDHDALKKELKTVDPAKIAEQGVGTHTARVQEELRRYIQYRLLVMPAVVAARLLADEKRPEAERAELKKAQEKDEADIADFMRKL